MERFDRLMAPPKSYLNWSPTRAWGNLSTHFWLPGSTQRARFHFPHTSALDEVCHKRLARFSRMHEPLGDVCLPCIINVHFDNTAYLLPGIIHTSCLNRYDTVPWCFHQVWIRTKSTFVNLWGRLKRHHISGPQDPSPSPIPRTPRPVLVLAGFCGGARQGRNTGMYRHWSVSEMSLWLSHIEAQTIGGELWRINRSTIPVLERVFGTSGKIRAFHVLEYSKYSEYSRATGEHTI